MKKIYESVDQEVDDIIRNRMTDKQFWDWVSGWLDVESIIEQVNEWDEELKKEAVVELRAIIKK